MGLLEKLAAKAEQAANKLAAKLSEQQAGAGQQQQQQGGYGYAPPNVYQQQQQQQQQPAYPPMGGAPQQQQQQYPGGGGFGGADYATAPPAPAPAPMPAPTFTSNAPPASAGRKKAVLVGISYVGTRNLLRGTVNDVQCMKHCLMTRFGYPEESIVVLRDDVQHPDFYPTRANILRAIQWLMMDLRFGDALFFHFSGHGSQLRDPTGMEADGMDETILPVDHASAGQIRDTELHRMMAAPLPEGVVLHTLFDSCHSGTVMDLPYEVKYDGSGAAYWQASRMYGTAGGTVFQLGACDESQTAADTAAMSRTAYTGAATYSFIDSIERYGPDQTYANLLLHMTQSLRALGKTSINPNQGGPGAMMGMAAPMIGGATMGMAGVMLGALLGGAMDRSRMSHQLPVLCCDKPVDIHQIQLMI